MSRPKDLNNKDVINERDSRSTGNRSTRRNDNKSKNKRKGNKTKNRSDYNQADLKEDGRNNKPGYYFVSKEVAEQASQLSFQNVLGYGNIDGFKVPTIMRLDTVACPGVTYGCQELYTGGDEFMALPSSSDTAILPTYLDSGKSGVNLMAAKLYTLLSSFTGRTASYAPQDVAMMILAIAGIAEFSEAIRRCFGLALTYNYYNRALNLGILRTMGLDVDDFVENISIYRMQFNVAISRINQVPLLDNIAFIEKSREIFQKVYQDDPTDMTQYFYYMPATWCWLDEEGDEDGSVLRHVPLHFEDIPIVKMATWIENLNKQITAVLESSTMNFIYADLLNMSNKIKTPLWTFDYLVENYVVLPEYNENALLQLHNGNMVGNAWDLPTGDTYKPSKYQFDSADLAGAYVTGGFDVFCDANKNDIVYNPAFLASSYYCKSKFALIDVPSGNPTLEDRIEALRFTATWPGAKMKCTDLQSVTDTHWVATFMALPDHFVTYAYIFDNVTAQSATATTNMGGTVIMRSLSDYDRVVPFTQWAHGPIFMTTRELQRVDKMISDLSFFTTVRHEYIKRLLNVMSVGLFEFRV